jgi:hypothetical protein
MGPHRSFSQAMMSCASRGVRRMPRGGWHHDEPGLADAGAGAQRRRGALREQLLAGGALRRHRLWGDNGYGQLGNNTLSGSSSFTPVQAKNLTGVASVAAGDFHSLALRQDGTVWAWGANEKGQRGNGNQYELYTPRQVTGVSGGTKLAAGHLHSLPFRVL